MAFENVIPILRMGSLMSSAKMLVMAASTSRPRLRTACLAFLRIFQRKGGYIIRYRCYDRFYRVFLRRSDLAADYLSAKELAVGDIYRLDSGFHPGLIIDGGGNTGLFTLRALALAKAGGDSPKVIVCEPLPRNIEQIKRHLAMNDVQAEILPECLGGQRGTMPFYCRQANESSFDRELPYDTVMEIPVSRLADVIGSSTADRILIKLDIEGAELEVLQDFVPGETRAVYVVGELHNIPQNGEAMARLLAEHGWTYELYDVGDLTATFRTCSPAATPLLGWAQQLKPATVGAQR